QPLPRIHALGFARRYFEKQRIELSHSRYRPHPLAFDFSRLPSRLPIVLSPIESIPGDLLYRLPPFRQDLPHLLHAPRLRKSPAHPDDGDRFLASRLLLCCSGLRPLPPIPIHDHLPRRSPLLRLPLWLFPLLVEPLEPHPVLAQQILPDLAQRL